MTTRHTWLIASACAVVVISFAAWAAWMWVPRLFPSWTVKHSPWLRPALRAAKGNEWLLSSVMGRIERADDPVAELAPILHDADADVRFWAVACLLHHGDAKAEPFLIDRMAVEPSRRVRRCVVIALGSLGGARSAPLCERLKSDPELGVVAAGSLERILERMQTPSP